MLEEDASVNAAVALAGSNVGKWNVSNTNVSCDVERVLESEMIHHHRKRLH
jgi:hypothetical protein